MTSRSHLKLPKCKIAWSSNKLRVFQRNIYRSGAALECLYHCSLVRISWRHRQSLLAWEGGRKRERNGGKGGSLFLHDSSCNANFRLDSCRACLLTSQVVLAFSFSVEPLLDLSLTLFALLVTFSIICLYFTLHLSLSLPLSHSLSGKEASNHTLRPGGPPPIPKSPSKVNTLSQRHTH